jgi:hypothetical protein
MDGEEVMQKLRIEMLDGTWVEVPEAQIGQFFAENAGKFKYDPIYTYDRPRKKAMAEAEQTMTPPEQVLSIEYDCFQST